MYESGKSNKKCSKKVLIDNPDIVTSYKNGKGQVIGFLIGQVQKKLKGKEILNLFNDKIVELIRKNFKKWLI